MIHDVEKVVDFYYGEYKSGFLSKKHNLRLNVYPSYIEGDGFYLSNGVLSSNTFSFKISFSDIKKAYSDTYNGKPVLLIDYSCSTIAGNTVKTILFFNIDDLQQWILTIENTKRIFLEKQEYKKEQETKQRELKKQLEIAKERKVDDFFTSCYQFHIKENTPVYTLFEGKNKTALIYLDNNKSINFLKIDGYAEEESDGIIEYNKIHYYEKVGDIHYTSQIHGTYSNYSGGFTGANFSKLITAGGGLLFGLLGITAGALLSYKPAKQEASHTNFQIDSDISKIDDRSIILNFYSDLKKQYVDITLPYDMYNFLQTYLPEKRYEIVEEIEKSVAVSQSTKFIETKDHKTRNFEQILGGGNDQSVEFKQKIEKLVIMREAQILSQEEFEEQKRKLLELL